MLEIVECTDRLQKERNKERKNTKRRGKRKEKKRRRNIFPRIPHLVYIFRLRKVAATSTRVCARVTVCTIHRRPCVSSVWYADFLRTLGFISLLRPLVWAILSDARFYRQDFFISLLFFYSTLLFFSSLFFIIFLLFYLFLFSCNNKKRGRKKEREKKERTEGN